MHWLNRMIDLIIVVVLSVLLAPVAIWLDGPLRVALGIPFVLFFPGYTLIAALFPRKVNFNGVERMALSFGLSIAMVPLIGLALNYTPWGINTALIHFSMFGVVLCLAMVAVLRRLGLSSEERYFVDFASWYRQLTLGWRTGGTWDRLLLVLLVVLLLGGIGISVYMVQHPNEGDGFTEFYILGPNGMMSDYPRNLIVGQEEFVIMGIINREHDTALYRTEVNIDGDDMGVTNSINLEHKEKWEQVVNFEPIKTGTGQQVQFVLYMNDMPEPYKEVHLWVDVKEESFRN